jgi:hypothetical protein
METKMNTYKAIIDNEEFSKITAMKKILGYSDADIVENFRNIAKEKCLTEIGEYWAGKINSEGPAGEYSNPPIPIKGISDKDDDSSDDSGDGGDGGENNNEGDDSAEPSDKGGEKPEEPEEQEAPAPSFGLG